MRLNKLIMASVLMLVTITLIPRIASADQIYATDQGHTEVLFSWNHAGVSTQNAEFTVAKGTLNLADNIEKSSVNVNIDTNSLSSGFDMLDTHLKSADFLEVATYPEIVFESTTIKQTGDKLFDVTGKLSIHGVTQSVTLKAEITHQGEHPVAKFIDYYKGKWIAIKATAEIDHQAFKVGPFSTGPISVVINTEMKAQ